MSKHGRNEQRKVVAGFLNAVAVAVLMAGSVALTLTNDPRWWLPIVAILLAASAHFGALSVVGGVEE